MSYANDNHKELTVADIGEIWLIKRITSLLYQPSDKITLGAGDDAAVLSPLDGKPVITVDTMSQGVHFDLAYMSPDDLGHRLLAANLSDMAAMGANPVAAVVSLALPGDTPVSFIEGLYTGFRALAEEYDVAIIGGDIVGSGNGITVTLTLIGEARDNILTRSDVNAGDSLLLTGYIGLAEAGLFHLNGKIKLEGGAAAEATTRHLRPTPRLKEGIALADSGLAMACIDTSDSLAISLYHLSEMSGVGFVVNADSLPVSLGLLEAYTLLTESGQRIDRSPIDFALSAGEDFELLFTCAPKNTDKIIELITGMGTPIAVIGEAAGKERGVKLLRGKKETEINASGFAHF